MSRLKYDKDKADKICALIADGVSLRSAAKQNDVGDTTFLSWCDLIPELDEQYTRAREARGVYYGDRIGEVVEKTITGEIDPAAARAAIDGLKWTAARMASKRLGDKIQAEVTGKNGGPIESTLNVSGLPTEVLTAIMAAKDATDQG